MYVCVHRRALALSRAKYFSSAFVKCFHYIHINTASSLYIYNRAGGLREPQSAAGAGRPERAEAERRSEGRGRPGGRPAPRLPRPGWAPAGAGKQGEVSSCFPWLERGAAAARGLGRWPRARETVFFCLKRRRGRPEARGCAGRRRPGGGPRPRCPPPPEPAAAALGPFQRALTWDRRPRFLRAGWRACPAQLPVHQSGKPRLGEGGRPCPGHAVGEARWSWRPGLWALSQPSVLMWGSHHPKSLLISTGPLLSGEMPQGGGALWPRSQ